MEKSTILSYIDKVYRRAIQSDSTVWSLNLDLWEWNSGVCVYGIIKAYNYTKNKEYKEFLKLWYKRNKDKRIAKSVNTVIPAHVPLFLYKNYRKSKKYLNICNEFANWSLNKAIKTDNGGLAHVWSVGGLEDYKNQLWVDSLFMAGIFMIDYGNFTHNDVLIKAGLEQFDIHIVSHYDKEQKLFYHGYHCKDKKQLGQHWGRGNGWIVASLVEILDILNNCEYDLFRFKMTFQEVMESAYSLKNNDGMLRTIISDDESYVEMTATMLFIYAALKGYRLGILESKFKDWGLEAVETVIKNITPEGYVLMTSGGTDCQDKEGYLKVPYVETKYSSGILLMLLSELASMPDESMKTGEKQELSTAYTNSN